MPALFPENDEGDMNLWTGNILLINIIGLTKKYTVIYNMNVVSYEYEFIFINLLKFYVTVDKTDDGCWHYRLPVKGGFDA